MARSVACGRCGKVNRKNLCDDCRSATYDSKDYRRNGNAIRSLARNAIAAGFHVYCCICEEKILEPAEVTVEHMRSVSQGGSNDLGNLGPAHRRCNFATAGPRSSGA